MKRILIPIDGSERSLHSLDWAMSILGPHEASFYVITVMDKQDEVRYAEQHGVRKPNPEDILAPAKQKLREYDYHTEVRYGAPGKEILKYAEEADINQIIMTKSTKKDWTRTIGSVTTYVVQHAKHIVTIVPE